jgi:hypothetical protein
MMREREAHLVVMRERSGRKREIGSPGSTITSGWPRWLRRRLKNSRSRTISCSPQMAPSLAPKQRQPLLPQAALIWWLCRWVWWGFFVGLMVKSWWICRCFVGLMLKSWWICSCGADLVGLMALQMGGWGVGFGCCHVELWMGCGFCKP